MLSESSTKVVGRRVAVAVRTARFTLIRLAP